MLLSAVLLLAGSSFALEIGAAVPHAERAMKNVDGSMVSVQSVKGEKGVMVIFSCNTCPYVIAWNERMTELGKKAQKNGIGVIVINSNDPKVQPGDNMDAMVEMAKNTGYTFPYVVDEESMMAKAFGATRTPEIFLFNADGKLVYHGAIDDNSQDASAVEKHYLRDAIHAVKKGTAIETTQTKAIGCTIKFHS